MKTLQLAGEHVVADMRMMLERMVKADAQEVRVVERDGGVSMFGSTMFPAGLADPSPLVLVHRGFALHETSEPPETEREPIDAVVEVRALLDRLPRLTEAPYALTMPPVEVTAVWAGVLPPRSGWQDHGVVDAGSLAQVAREGAERVQALLPEQPGQALVDRARREVWSLEVVPGVAAGAAFALDVLGFLEGQSQVRLHRTRVWSRLATSLGDVFARMP